MTGQEGGFYIRCFLPGELDSGSKTQSDRNPPFPFSEEPRPPPRRVEFGEPLQINSKRAEMRGPMRLPAATADQVMGLQ